MLPVQERKFRPDIEGIRGIASVTVMLYHAGFAFMAGGFVGVDVFYVLSGFLVTAGLLKEAEKRGRINFTDFMGRRFRRLLPVSALVIVLTILATYHWQGPTAGNSVAQDGIWTSLFLANWRFIAVGTDYLGAQSAASPLQHYWTLAIEGQFYLVWPLIMLALAFAAREFSRVPLRIITTAVLFVMFAVSYWWSIASTPNESTVAYFSTWTRIWEIAAGCLLAVFMPFILRVPRNLGSGLMIGGVALVLASCYFVMGDVPFPGWIAILPVLGASAVIVGGTVAADSPMDRLLQVKPLQLLGKYSYGMYLWHWPMLMLAPFVIGRDLSGLEKLLVLTLATLTAALTYHLIENPARNLNVLKGGAPRWSLAFGALLILAPVGVAQNAMRMNEEPPAISIDQAELASYPNEAEVVAEVAESVETTTWQEPEARIDNPAYSDECDVTRAATTSSACVHGDPDGDKIAIVYGDSHAAMWIPAFDIIGEAEGWQVVQLNKPGCITPEFPTYSNVLGREYTECGEYRSWALDKIAEIQPDLVIVTSARDGALRSVNGKGTTEGVDEAWEDGLARTLSSITPHASEVIVLGDQAYPSQAGITCLEANPNNVKKCGDPFEDAVHHQHNQMEARVAEANGAAYVDTVAWMCTEAFCPAVINDITVHRDRMHINENFAVWLSEALGHSTGMMTGDLVTSNVVEQAIVPATGAGSRQETGRGVHLAR